ncbi:N-acetylglucosamine kinase [Nonomuraea sp. CA-143628]|uniref:N-acetylglucosamine kinase n=1 Tax=Nonomuraea sp. CA-143628 TaxID=3239997 RepID=UPI003D900885
MSVTLVLGMDIGGTSSRVIVADLFGRLRGVGRAGGGNPVSRGPAAITAIRDALCAALVAVDPADVKAAVFGLAGGDVAVHDPEIAQALRAGWRQAGLRCTPTMVSDVTLAYVAGTDSAEGSVLVSGTGAVAAAIRERTIVRCADGHGWLLGDLGSGFWIGREGIRATLAAMDRCHPPSDLHREILHALGVAHAERRTLASTSATIDAAHRMPPAELAKLAPLILTAAEGGNVEARLIARRAAEHLTASLNAIRILGATSPIVLGGSLLTTANPLSQAVRASVRKVWPDAEIHRAGGGAAAAAWLAARRLSGVPALESHALYTRLLGAEPIPPRRSQKIR